MFKIAPSVALYVIGAGERSQHTANVVFRCSQVFERCAHCTISARASKIDQEGALVPVGRGRTVHT